MPELSIKEETQEPLLGMWIAVALIVETLIALDDLPREEILVTLSAAQAAAKGERRTAIAGMWLLIERGFS